MRIISGKHRRRKLLTNKGAVTRPITDRAKEILFERLNDLLNEARVADIFAGTGTLGLEALSRGAASVVFIEADHRAHELLIRNVEAIGVDDVSLCWRTDVLRCSFRPKGCNEFVPYDVVFFDPPYRMVEGISAGKPLYKSLQRLARDDASRENALLVLRTPEHATFEMPACWKLERQLDISSMKIHFYRKAATEQ